MDLLFAHERADDDGGQVLADGIEDTSAASGVEQVPVHEPENLADVSANANDLPAQGWAVVFAAGQEHMLDRIQPLIDRRAEDQQADVMTIEVPPGMDEAAAMAWWKNDYPTLYDRERDRPRYLLILGDMDQVSLPTQQALAINGFPGRLVCPSDDGYEAYVDKVLEWEKHPSEHAQPRSLFFTVHDGTDATRSGYDHLIDPLYAMCHKDWREDRRRSFPAAAVLNEGDRDDPYPDELLDLVTERHPTVLLSLSHGLGPPRKRPWTPEQARSRQGAMVFGSAGSLQAGDVANGSFLPGGLWFYFACFGAGTPPSSEYHAWLEMLAAQGMQGLGPLQQVLAGLDQQGGFTSAIAQAALANPSGPLAVLGHVDLAWSYSYQEITVRADRTITRNKRADEFYNIVQKMIKGERAGVSILNLQQDLTKVSQELNSRYNRAKKAGGDVEGATEEARLNLANLWMLRQDLNGYVLLGDPAARLPLAREQPRKRRGMSVLAGFVGAPASGARATRPVDDRRVRTVERTILDLAAKRITADDAAEDLQVSPDTAERWAEAYREAGRDALAALLDKEDSA